MLELAIQGQPHVRALDSLAPHTMAGLVGILEAHPETSFKFIVGLDTLLRLDEWDNHEQIVRQAAFAVARRAGSSESQLEGLRRRLGSLGPALRVELFELGEHARASSMTIRRQIAAGERPDSLDQAVYQYIATHRLYS